VRALLFLLTLAVAAPAAAQPVVTSPAPERVAITIYRDPERGLSSMNLEWLGGYALVSETRRVRLPPGESELRFEGVTAGLVPQSAIVTGLGPAVIEKNRDARLLSPGSLLAAHLGQRLTLRRTSLATGAMREQEAIVRSTAGGVVLQTADGIETLRCTALAETVVADQVPVGLSAKPTLSVRVRSPGAIERDVTLSYITNNFDWQADYIADLAPDGRTLRLFGWLTLANGDDTALEQADTQAVAGKLNRERVWVDRGDAPPIQISCWPSGKTTDLPLDERGIPPPPPPPPPAPATMRSSESIVVTGSRIMAREERLGDVRLYRIPIAVTVAARSQKQVALLERPAVRVERKLRLRASPGELSQPLDRVLLTRNRSAEGLGLALPAGKVALFASHGGRRILIGEGRIDDYTIGEKVEIRVASAPGVRARQSEVPDRPGVYRLTVTNDLPTPEEVEVELPLEARGSGLKRGDGAMLWNVRVPANRSAELVYRVSDGG
jgi:hypothetical protein